MVLSPTPTVVAGSSVVFFQVCLNGDSKSPVNPPAPHTLTQTHSLSSSSSSSSRNPAWRTTTRHAWAFCNFYDKGDRCQFCSLHAVSFRDALTLTRISVEILIIKRSEIAFSPPLWRNAWLSAAFALIISSPPRRHRTDSQKQQPMARVQSDELMSEKVRMGRVCVCGWVGGHTDVSHKILLLLSPVTFLLLQLIKKHRRVEKTILC